MNGLKHLLLLLFFISGFMGELGNWFAIAIGVVSIVILIIDMLKSHRGFFYELGKFFVGGVTIWFLYSVIIYTAYLLVMYLFYGISFGESAELLNSASSSGISLSGFLSSIMFIPIVYNSYASIFRKDKRKSKEQKLEGSRLEDDFEELSLSEDDKLYIQRNK